MSLLSPVERAPRDPILGLNETFREDHRDGKVNLGGGVYTDENGRIPLLDCVQEAESTIIASRKPYGYLPIDGLKTYDDAVAKLVFDDSVTRDRVAVV